MCSAAICFDGEIYFHATARFLPSSQEVLIYLPTCGAITIYIPQSAHIQIIPTLARIFYGFQKKAFFSKYQPTFGRI